MVNYSKCCGKYVTTNTSFKSKNILQTSKLVSNEDYHCSKCKQSTTENGNLRKNNGNDMKIYNNFSDNETSKHKVFDHFADFGKTIQL